MQKSRTNLRCSTTNKGSSLQSLSNPERTSPHTLSFNVALGIGSSGSVVCQLTAVGVSHQAWNCASSQLVDK